MTTKTQRTLLPDDAGASKKIGEKICNDKSFCLFEHLSLQRMETKGQKEIDRSNRFSNRRRRESPSRRSNFTRERVSGGHNSYVHEAEVLAITDPNMNLVRRCRRTPPWKRSETKRFLEDAQRYQRGRGDPSKRSEQKKGAHRYHGSDFGSVAQQPILPGLYNTENDDRWRSVGRRQYGNTRNEISPGMPGLFRSSMILQERSTGRKMKGGL